MRFELIILDGSGKRYLLPAGGEVLVGSAAESAIRLAAADVSRRHAILTVRRGGVFLVDLGSKNGTFVAGQKVKEVRLNAGDLVRFASVLTLLQPVSSSSDVDEVAAEGALPAGDRGPRDHTDEMPTVGEASEISWLLASWGRDYGSARTATLEWIVRAAGARGAALLRREGADTVVVAVAGDVGSVIGNASLFSVLEEAAACAKVFETVTIEEGAGRVAAVKCAESCWLLLVVGDANPAAAQMALYVRAVLVAQRLDR